MPHAVLSPKAKKDLVGILVYTQKQWGVNQRIKYHNQLEDRLLDLSHNPEKGRKSTRIKPELLFYREGRHVIFYRKALPRY
jgi:toxin ParE1/3/4